MMMLEESSVNSDAAGYHAQGLFQAATQPTFKKAKKNKKKTMVQSGLGPAALYGFKFLWCERGGEVVLSFILLKNPFEDHKMS